MIFGYDYWYFQSAIHPKTCDEVVKFALTKKEEVAITGSEPEPQDSHYKEIFEKRQSNIAWLNERWIYNILQPYVAEANRNSGWNIQWDYSESIQFTKYKLNQFYGWHQDVQEKPYDGKDENYNGKIRKLSIIITLVDGSEYEGGDLQINFRHRYIDEVIQTMDEIRPKGSVIIFPSFLWHRVTPVTKGTRYTLVNWNLGWPWQ
jgi:PKHD-type hydroxylase|tara:strand:- start:3116 stop:3727 length:612 start_codon:yes stop_codon:yes gene_type:complete